MQIAIIVARSMNGVIGRGGLIPWDIPNDKKHFRLLTTGDGRNAVIMGRKTWQSIGRPLAGRTTIVLTHQLGGFDMAASLPLNHRMCAITTLDSVLVAPSLDDALDMARQRSVHTAWIAGGDTVYSAALPLCCRLCITEVLADVEGDTYFPQFDRSLYDMAESPLQQGGICDERNVEYKFVTYTRR